MNLAKACRPVLLASFSWLLLMVFTGAAYGAAIHWTVMGSPTEVIITGRSEVSGAITLIYDDPDDVTTGGPDQLAIIYGPNPYGPAVQIDNYTDTGIRVFGPAFAIQGHPLSLIAQNSTSFGSCAGQIFINVPAGVTLHNGDVIRVEGVRLRVDEIQGVHSNQDIWVQLQSVNNPGGHVFSPDTVRVAKTFPGMLVGTTSGANLSITITEGFYRAFVAKDANNDGIATSLDRLDSGGPLATTTTGFASWLGGGGGAGAVNINGTMVEIFLSNIPNSVTSVIWPSTVASTNLAAYTWFQKIPTSETFVPGTSYNGYASAVYEYFTKNQTGESDISLENFKFSPALTNGQGVLAGATLWPTAESVGTCTGVYTNTPGLNPGGWHYGHPFGSSGIGPFDSGALGKPRFATLWQPPNPARISDFNSDGKADIVWRNTSIGSLDVWFMNGATVKGDAWPPPVSDQQWQIAGIGDFNGDGAADVLWRYAPTGVMNLWFMSGIAVTSDAWLPCVSDPHWQIAGIGDFNKDGKSDIVWRNTASGDIDVWFMNGGIVTSDAWLPSVGDQQWQIAGIGDFNGDGGGDIVWRYIPSGDIDVWLMDGVTVTNDVWLPSVADPHWQINAIGDFNGDGNAEIVWRHTVYGCINIWFMNRVTLVSDSWLPTVTDLQWKIFGPR